MIIDQALFISGAVLYSQTESHASLMMILGAVSK